MYPYLISLSVSVLVGAVVYEVVREKAAWRRFQHSLERLTES